MGFAEKLRIRRFVLVALAMLIEFSVENFRSYREKKTFSLVASAAQELPGNLVAIPDSSKSLVRATVIYGANASGKSNLLEAMDSLSSLLIRPTDRSFMQQEIELPPFELDKRSRLLPSRFEVRFLLDGVTFDYRIAARPGLIEEEELAAYPSGRRQVWFSRTGMDITLRRVNLNGPKEKLLKEVTHPGAPFLAVAATFEHPQLTPPARWLGSNLFLHRAIRSTGVGFTVSRCVQDPKVLEWVNNFLRHADLGIQRVEIVARKTATLFEEIAHQLYELNFIHAGENGFTAKLPILYESHGTQRFFLLLARFHDALHEKQQLTVIDEFGEGLHPSLVREIVRLFQDPKQNPRGSQLVFTTHDTSLLSAKLFRRDQVWFTEKGPSGATDLYSLQDIKEVRQDEAFEKGYLRGRYGAIPFFGSFDFPPCAESEREPPNRPPGALPTAEEDSSDRD